jgi:adenine-specific DNA methylase
MFGISKWGEMFNARQAVCLVTFSGLVKRSFEKVFEETKDRDYAKAVTTYLALTFDSMAHYLSISSTYLKEGMISTFIQGQAIPFRWDYGESNPFGERVGTWNYALNQTIAVLNYLSADELVPAVVQQGGAQRLPYPDAMFDAVITDPPYYDLVPYSDLSDFFYVWLKRIVGKLYPDLFSTPLAPKSDELVQQSDRVTSASKRIKDKNFYENGIESALREVSRVLKPNGICVVVFAHKTLFAWESLIKALVQAGFSISSSWPLHTERKARMRAFQSAVLASSVWLVCRKRDPNAETGSWKTAQRELDEKVRERLDFFLREGIRGADALLSAIGPALQVFSRYRSVKKIDETPISVGDFLDRVREVVAHHALSTVLSERELGNVDPATAFYVLWKWTFEPTIQNGKTETAKRSGRKGNGNHVLIPYDDALKIARSVGADIDNLLKTHLLKQEKSSTTKYVQLLGPSERKRVSGLGETARDGTPPSTIDTIHKALDLWASMQQRELEDYLDKSGARNNETFWQVAQALSNLLPIQSKEKQLLDGLLGRHAGGSEIRPRDLRSLDDFMKKEEK